MKVTTFELTEEWRYHKSTRILRKRSRHGLGIEKF
jgi:hypothetical protein